MSVDALLQVFKDHSDVSPGVQAVLIAMAWKTPQGKDSTVPVSYQQLADLTRQSIRTVQRNVLAALSSGAAELVWARPGQPARYRVNRGEWFVPGSPAELEAALGIADPGHDDVGVRQNDVGGQDKMSRDLRQNDAPLKKKNKKEEKEEQQPSLFEAKNADLLDRLREKGVVK